MTKTRNLILAVVAILLALGMTSPACAAKRTDVDLEVPVSGVAMFGDSMTVGAKPILDARYPSWSIDAKWGRGVTQLPSRINLWLSLHENPPAIAIIALGTNEEAGWDKADYQAALRMFPYNTRVVFVNTYRPAIPAPGDGSLYSAWMRDLAAKRPMTTVADWRGAAIANPSYVSEDQKHQSQPEGATAWANLVISAVKRVRTM
jgi:hypothetical protein